MASPKRIIKGLLKHADIQIGGKRPQDIQIHNSKLYPRVLAGGSIALGEAYMDGWWDANSLDEFFNHILSAKVDSKVVGLKKMLVPYLKAKLLNRQKTHAHHIGEWHYDISNDLYFEMLGKTMQYSCAYWKSAKTLDQAQEAKMDLICKKLNLKKGETLLDIGCGWGGLLKYAAKKYGVIGTGVTVSKEQAKFARDNCKDLPVTILIKDYRKLGQRFDKVVSVGMIEHVGWKNYSEYMRVARNCLNAGGLFLVHTIGSSKTSNSMGDPWLDKYIFPDGQLPSVQQLAKASEKYFIMEDWHNFGPYYDKTLLAWQEKFNKAWPKLKKNYDKRFYRMWIYYLCCCAGAFRARHIQLWQVVLSKRGVVGGYERLS